jgi:hypothetical protein
MKRSEPIWLTANERMPALTESTELVSVDDTIDEIASKALKEARHVEEAEKYCKNPGPIVPPKLLR